MGKKCYCLDCPEHNWNPWSPTELSLEEALVAHDNTCHDGESHVIIIENGDRKA